MNMKNVMAALAVAMLMPALAPTAAAEDDTCANALLADYNNADTPNEATTYALAADESKVFEVFIPDVALLSAPEMRELLLTPVDAAGQMTDFQELRFSVYRLQPSAVGDVCVPLIAATFNPVDSLPEYVLIGGVSPDSEPTTGTTFFIKVERTPVPLSSVDESERFTIDLNEP